MDDATIKSLLQPNFKLASKYLLVNLPDGVKYNNLCGPVSCTLCLKAQVRSNLSTDEQPNSDNPH